MPCIRTYLVRVLLPLLRAVLDKTILQRFSEMLCRNDVVTGKIGDRSRDTNDAMKSAGG